MGFSIQAFSINDQESVKLLLSKEIIIEKKKIEDKVWPELTMYAYIKSKPLDAIAVFAAYEHQKNYIPNLIKSKIVKEISPTENHVDYELKMPWPLSNGTYINYHKLSSPAQNTYRCNWKGVSSNSTDEVYGQATFTPFQDGTLFQYVTFVDPKSIFAGVLKKLMVTDVKKSVEAIISEVEKIKDSDPKLLELFRSKIVGSLQGSKI